MIHWKSSITSIISSTFLSGNYTSACDYTNITDFVFLKKFSIDIHPPKAPKIIEVLWNPPPLHWIKCNTDGSSNTNTSSCGGIFRDRNADFLMCFAENTGHENAYFAELSGAMRAIELAKLHNWQSLWLESDSALVVNAFKNISQVPWKLRNRWENCILATRNMNFIVSHVFREGNECADMLANIGLSLNCLTIWLELPDCIKSIFIKNKLGWPNNRFVY
ncbi:uncharacterized protein [Medicago truncatula]|nr:uncharacterized protein LOC112419299 [Medicago truncatula]